ncbi:MAG: hypothetical protein RR735_03930 [Bacteroidales bacterium]
MAITTGFNPSTFSCRAILLDVVVFPLLDGPAIRTSLTLPFLS